MFRLASWMMVLSTAVSACGQITDELQPIDDCGVLVNGGGCVLFEGAGGSYVLVADLEGYRFGDSVRVVGTINPYCNNICAAETDGCIQGATVYDPAVYPCGTEIPSLAEDLISGACAAASGALIMICVCGMWMTRTRRVACGRGCRG